MIENWVILGATSSMAKAFARSVSAQGARVFLAGRDLVDLERSAQDCALRGAIEATALEFDARAQSTFEQLVTQIAAYDGTLNVAVFVGSMPPQAEIDLNPALIEGIVCDSFTGPAAFLQAIAPEMERRKGGCVIGVGSVAGDRGRIGNYVYGAAKAGFHTYLSGLRNRLTRSGGHVVTVKPGFVDSAMTWGIEGMFLVAPPERVAKDLLRAAEKRKDVIYTPFFWAVIMGIITRIPERVFKKLSI